jgi:hypothetical protein
MVFFRSWLAWGVPVGRIRRYLHSAWSWTVSLYPLTAIVNKRGKLSFVIFARRENEGDGAFYDLLDRQVRKAMLE